MQFSWKLPSVRFTKGSGIFYLKTHIYEDEITVMLTSAIVGFEHLIRLKVLFPRQFLPCDNNLLFQTCKYIHSDSLKMKICFATAFPAVKGKIPELWSLSKKEWSQLKLYWLEFLVLYSPPVSLWYLIEIKTS